MNNYKPDNMVGRTMVYDTEETSIYSPNRQDDAATNKSWQNAFKAATGADIDGSGIQRIITIAYYSDKVYLIVSSPDKTKNTFEEKQFELLSSVDTPVDLSKTSKCLRVVTLLVIKQEKYQRSNLMI